MRERVRKGKPMDQRFDCDVAIIGYGPVGAALANALGRHGAVEVERRVLAGPSLHTKAL